MAAAWNQAPFFPALAMGPLVPPASAATLSNYPPSTGCHRSSSQREPRCPLPPVFSAVSRAPAARQPIQDEARERTGRRRGSRRGPAGGLDQEGWIEGASCKWSTTCEIERDER